MMKNQPHLCVGDASKFVSSMLVSTAVLVILAGITRAAPVVYTDESLYLDELATLGYAAVHESFEDDIVWADSRNSIVSPGRTPTVTSRGIVWTSNYLQNEIATGDVGGSAPHGTYAIYSLPHGNTTDSGLYCDDAEDPIPIQCYQNDGLKVESQSGGTLYAFGGRIDTANSGKISFLLDGVDINGNDTDNIDNWQREGEWADNWAFVGVIDTDGFLSAELKELRGKDYQQVYLFADDFTVGTLPVPGDADRDGAVDVSDLGILATHYGTLSGAEWGDGDFTGEGRVDVSDLGILATHYGETVLVVPEPSSIMLLGIVLPGSLASLRRARHGR